MTRRFPVCHARRPKSRSFGEPHDRRHHAALGIACPLTAWENHFRRLSAQRSLTDAGFIDTYLTGVIYPESYLVPLQILVALLIVISWTGLVITHRRRRRESVARRQSFS